MARTRDHPEVPVDRLRWRCDPAGLPFETTRELTPLTDVVGQERALEAFRFALSTDAPGYNVFVTGAPHSGRLELVEKILRERSSRGPGKTPDDLAYVNNFENPESPRLLRFAAGTGREFRAAVHGFVEALKREAPQLFESEEYLARKKEISDTHDRRLRDFFKELDRQVKDQGFALVNVQAGPMQMPELMPVVDGEPVPVSQLEEMAERSRFPTEELESIRRRHETLKRDIDHIFLQVRDVHRELSQKGEEVDRAMFRATAERLASPVRERFRAEAVVRYLDQMLDDMVEHLDDFRSGGRQPVPGLPGVVVQTVDLFQAYEVNLVVDNSEQQGAPVIVESYPTYRNIFGSIERVVDRNGVLRTDYSKIRVGSFVRASGGTLVISLWDALREPGVWPALSRALKSRTLEIQSFDPFFLISSTGGVKPEPIEVDTKVVVIGDAQLYHLLRHFDEDLPKVFRVRADLDTTTDRNDAAVLQLARFLARLCADEGLCHFDRTGVAALVEESVRLAGRTEKLSTAFPVVAEIVREASWWAHEDSCELVAAAQVRRAIESRRFRGNLFEQKVQELIDRDSLLIDTTGAVVGQVNGLSVYGFGDGATDAFGRPTRITAATALGREGVISIEREAEMSGPIHSKGVYILSGYLRRMFAQSKPLAVSASLAFEQSYGGVDGDSASSTEIYAILSSLAGVPIAQGIAVTGSVNQRGEVQAIGGVNEKIEGFFEVCRRKGLTGDQGVIIPEANLSDLMLRDEVIGAIREGRFHLWAVRDIATGLEILTGEPAGAMAPDGAYPPATVFGRADARLHQMAETMQRWAGGERRES